jgi:hypothetical protein
MRHAATRQDWPSAFVVVLVLLVVYNANGREIASYDSQPTKYAARELLSRGTLALNHVVGSTPQLMERPAFVAARDGRYRSAYSPAPAIAAAAITWPLWKSGLVDIRDPQGPKLIAVMGASFLTACAVALAFVTARRELSRTRALLLALALGLGTGYWSTISQTLWQHETAVFGLALGVFGLALARERQSVATLAIIGIGLGIAGASRPQLSPAIAVVLAGVFAAVPPRRAWIPAAIAAAFAASLVASNLRWFGNPLGAAALLEALHPTIHATERTFDPSVAGFAGLLVSPSRGLLVYSPIVLITLAGIRALIAGGWQSATRWCALAAAAQYAFYGCYSVWWAGHTYGPRYMLDVLPLLVPLATAGLARLQPRRPATVLAIVALTWSILVAGTGAFVFPHERWNTDPSDVDRHHERLWDWNDPQILRCWQRGWSPQNFDLFTVNETANGTGQMAKSRR